MQKTTLYLPDELKSAVEQQARQRRVSEAQVIREAIASAVTRPTPRAGLFESRGGIGGAGRGAPGRLRHTVIIADTSGLLALFDRGEPEHQAVSHAVSRIAGPLVVSPYVVAELDYLVGTRIGVAQELAVLRELSGGAYLLPEFGPSDMAKAANVVERYRDQDIGIADASIVVLAERYATRQLLTLDRRHFSVLRPDAWRALHPPALRPLGRCPPG